jgi:hypothetical protein
MIARSSKLHADASYYFNPLGNLMYTCYASSIHDTTFAEKSNLKGDPVLARDFNEFLFTSYVQKIFPRVEFHSNPIKTSIPPTERDSPLNLNYKMSKTNRMLQLL